MATEGTDITWWAVVSAFGGTVIGSVLGGTISFWLQKRSLSATKALHDSDRKEVRKALGYALLFKMIRLCSDLQQIGGPVFSAVLKAQKEGHVDELWPCVVPVGPLPDSIKFSPEEMALILSLDNKLFNDMAAMDDLHNSTVAIFGLYAEKRAALTAMLTPTAIVGAVGSTPLTKEQREKMRPQSIELDILVNAMVERTHIDGKEALNCLRELHAVLEREFNLKHKLEMKRGYGGDEFDDATSGNAQPQPYYHHYKG